MMSKDKNPSLCSGQLLQMMMNRIATVQVCDATKMIRISEVWYKQTYNTIFCTNPLLPG